ncbi:MAG: hypothetical protein E6265_18400 [Enterobacteriaceae bacterium]|jgi:hypothetical protein|nr:hypothetical protein [Enterobacteriaceae bacterium]
METETFSACFYEQELPIFGTNALMAVNLINHKTKNKGKTMLIEQAPQLETERLILKQYMLEDFPALF